jgi:ribonuclease HI
MKEVNIYTDGACSGNPGAGGYGAILCYRDKSREISAGYRLTTNNRMELKAAIEALRLLKEPCQVTLWSDSKYLVEAINQHWLDGWKKKNFMDPKTKQKRVNFDLWEQLSEQLSRHNVQFIWVKGHDGHPQNERCDELAVSALKQEHLLLDEGYIQ